MRSDDVVNRRLETGRGFAGDVVFDFVEQVTDREVGGRSAAFMPLHRRMNTTLEFCVSLSTIGH